MVVIQLRTSRNSNFAVVADASAILGFAAVVRDNRVGTDFNRTAVSDCRNCIVNQIYGCLICKLDICVSRLSGSYSQSTDIVTLYDFIGYRIAGAGNCQRCTVLYVDITTVHEDTAVSVILYQQGSTIFHGKNICICITSNTHIVAADFRIRVIQCQPASYKALIFALCNVKRGIYYVDFEVVNAIGNSITSIRTINNNRRTFLNIQISKTFICHQCSIRSVLNCQFRTALYINGSIIICVNTMFLHNAGTAFVQCQHAFTTHGNSPLCILISKDYIGLIKRQRSIDIERMIFSILLGNGNGFVVTVDNDGLGEHADGQRAILTNLNRSAVLCIVDCCIKRIILHIADFRGKRFCRSRGRRAAGIGTACAALFAAGSRRAAFAAFAFIARSAGLYIIAADRCAGFVTVITGGWVCVARVVSVCIGAGILSVSGIIYYIFNAVIRRSGNGCVVHRRRGSVCCAFFGRERGHGQHGEHHQTGESAGEETVISPFHAKTSSACIQTQRR